MELRSGHADNIGDLLLGLAGSTSQLLDAAPTFASADVGERLFKGVASTGVVPSPAPPEGWLRCGAAASRDAEEVDEAKLYIAAAPDPAFSAPTWFHGG
jgi:hypothetical protein